MAKLASTVADLHRLGIVHGRIDPTHVLIGAGPRPVLCGFTGGGADGEVPPEGPGPIAEFRDPAARANAPLSPTVDVYALGTLLRVLLVGDGADIEPIPERRFVLRRGRPWNGYLRRALLTLADQCTDEEPLRRPSAGRLAADIQAVLPRSSDGPPRLTAARNEITDHDDSFALVGHEAVQPGRERLGRRLTLAASVVGLVLVFWGVAAMRRGGDTTAAKPPPPATTAPPTSVPTSAPSPTPTRTTDVTLVGERVVSVDGHRFSVGDPGDRVVLGDWNCDGTPTAALVRPSTGQVYVFDLWPAPGVEATIKPVDTMSGAVNLRAEARGQCSALFAIRADGSESEVL